MTKLEFTSSVIESLAWPLVILTMAIILRKPIIKIFSNLNKLTYNNLEMDFSQKLETIETQMEAKEITVDDIQTSNVDIIKKKDILTVAKISPAAAITMAWSMVEQEIISTIRRLSISPDYPPNNSPLKNINLLVNAELIDNETRNILDELRKIRNKAVHGHVNNEYISYLEAEKYYELAIKAIKFLETIKK